MWRQSYLQETTAYFHRMQHLKRERAQSGIFNRHQWRCGSANSEKAPFDFDLVLSTVNKGKFHPRKSLDPCNEIELQNLDVENPGLQRRTGILYRSTAQDSVVLNLDSPPTIFPSGISIFSLRSTDLAWLIVWMETTTKPSNIFRFVSVWNPGAIFKTQQTTSSLRAILEPNKLSNPGLLSIRKF